MRQELEGLIPNLRKERIIITKMVESDENDDSLLFNSLKGKYKEISSDTNDKLDELAKRYSYDDLFKNISILIDEKVSRQEDAEDYVTLLGLVNTNNMAKMAERMTFFESDCFSNQLIMNTYELYLWLIKNNDYSEELKKSMRTDIVMKLVNSRAFRYYFAGDFEKARDIGDSSLYYDEEDRNRLGTLYSTLMNGQIDLSNKFEVYEGIMDDTSFNSRKEVLKMEFAAISLMLMRDRFLIPVASVEYSDFTKDVMTDASSILDEFVERKKKKENKKTITL